jgi:hypothetical protein
MYSTSFAFHFRLFPSIYANKSNTTSPLASSIITTIIMYSVYSIDFQAINEL